MEEDKKELVELGVRGRAGKNKRGLFFYNIELVDPSDETIIESFNIGPYDTEAEAKQKGKDEVEEILKNLGAQNVVDNKTGLPV